MHTALQPECIPEVGETLGYRSGLVWLSGLSLGLEFCQIWISNIVHVPSGMGFKRIQAARAILFEGISPSSFDEKREGEITYKKVHAQAMGKVHVRSIKK